MAVKVRPVQLTPTSDVDGPALAEESEIYSEILPEVSCYLLALKYT
jgi:hypothetical protein